MQVLIIQFKF